MFRAPGMWLATYSERFPGIQDDRARVGQDASDLLSANFLRFFVDLGERSAINAAHLCIRHMRQAYYQQHG